MEIKNRLVRAGAVIPLLFLTACASMQQAARNAEMDRTLVGSDFRAAALLAESRMGVKPNEAGELPPVTLSAKNVLDHLEAAEAWRMAGEYDRSIGHFDAAESALQQVELQSMVASGGKQLGAVLLNDSVLDYIPSPAEAVMINYYKALSFLGRGKVDDARVELNRADDRTRRAVERYEKEIASAQQEANEKNAQASYSNDKVRTLVDQKFPEMAAWATYREFIVPPATYLQALFLSRSADRSDQEKARTLFERVLGVSEAHPVVAQDALEASAGRTCPTNDCVWILAEYGQGPELQERRFTLPVATQKGLVTVNLALPALVSRTTVEEPPFRVAADAQTVPMSQMASMDRIVQTEFQKRFPGIATRAVVSATVKAVAQEAVNKNASPMAGLIANIASIASTSADLRMWRSMPARFTLARVSRRPGVPLTVETAQGPVQIPLPETGAQLVHLKMTSAQTAPKFEVLPI